MLDKIYLIILTAIAPISELRGSIPLGLYLGLDPVTTFFVSVISNTLIFFPIYFVVELFYEKIFSNITFFKKYLERSRRIGKPYVDKYGILGLMIFVAVPLPLTGAWTATLLAWLMGMDLKKSFITIALGVLVAGLIVMAISLGVFELIF